MAANNQTSLQTLSGPGRPARALALATLLLCLGLVPQGRGADLLVPKASAATPAVAAGAGQKTDYRQLTDQLGKLILETGFVQQAIAEIGLFKQAGFLYQPQLAVSSLLERTGQKSRDWKAVVSGLVLADRSFAFCFGSVDDVEREQKVLTSLLPEGTAPALSRANIKKLQDSLLTEQGQAQLAAHVADTSSKLLAWIRKNPEDVRLFGAQLYGIFIERMYLSAIMALAAVEEGIEDPLYKVDLKTGERMRSVLRLLADHNCLGEASLSKKRAATLQQILALAVPASGKPSLQSMQTIVTLCDDERDAILGQ